MNCTPARIAAITAATVSALGLLTGTAEAATPLPDPIGTHTEQRIDPATGQPVTARITEYPDITVRSESVAPAPGTGGLSLRAEDGTVVGLMAEGDHARFLACHSTDPDLIQVRQITHGHGGWGAYEGYVKASATTAPGQFPCHR
ncbi:hypothetical protein GCM10020000_86780 [Streptomyces olivoverticillatus]